MSWKLYEVDSLLRDAIAAADAHVNMDTGEVAPDWARFLDDLQMERDHKALSVAAMVREFSAEAEAIGTERKRLQARERTAANKAESLRSYLAQHVKEGEKLSDTRVSIGWVTRDAVNITNASLVPDDLCKIERTPMLKVIGDILKSGKNVPGAIPVKRTSLTIR